MKFEEYRKRSKKNTDTRQWDKLLYLYETFYDGKLIDERKHYT